MVCTHARHTIMPTQVGISARDTHTNTISSLTKSNKENGESCKNA